MQVRSPGARGVAPRAPLAAALALVAALVAPARAGAPSADGAGAGAPGPAAAPGESRAAAIARYESFLARYPQSSLRAEVLFTLAQLYEEEEVARALALAADGAASDDGDRIPHPDAIRCYREIVDAHPRFPDRAACLYRLGVALTEERDDAQATDVLSQLLAESPSGPFAAAAQVRRGEIALRRADGAAAAAAFSAALARGADAHAEKLYYRLGWARYSARDDAGARDALLAGIAHEESIGSGADVGFLREMLHLLAVVLVGGAGDGGAAAGPAAAAKGRAATVPGDAAQIEAVIAAISPGAVRRAFLQEYGVLLDEAERAVEAIAILDRAVAEDPAHAEAATIAQTAIGAAVKARQMGQAADRMVRFAETYGAGSAWRARQSLADDEARRIEDLCEENLYKAGVLSYEAARAMPGGAAAAAAAGAGGEALARADRTLRLAVVRHPNAPERDEAWFLLGEIARSTERWDDALAAYDAVSLASLPPARREALLFGRVLAREALRADAAKALGEESEAVREHARLELAAIDAYLEAAPRPEEIAPLRKKRAELLAAVGRYDEAAALFEESGDAERAAAALYASTAERGARGERERAGLALLDLAARYPRAKVSPAARLDAVEHLSRAGRADTLAAWLAAFPDQPAAAFAPGDSLMRVVAAAAARAAANDPALAARLYVDAARFGKGDAAAGMLLRAGEALRAAGRTEEAAETFASALARYPGSREAFAGALVAVDLTADSLGRVDRGLALLDAARAAAARGTEAERAAWNRRRGHALALANRRDEALAALDACIAAYTASAARATAVPASESAPGVETAARTSPAPGDADRALLDREAALASIERGDLLRADLTARRGKAALSSKEAEALGRKTDDVVATYQIAIQLAFRDLVARAGAGVAEALAHLARALLERDLAARDAAFASTMTRAADGAVAAAFAVVSLPDASEDEWVRAAAARLALRRDLAGRALAAVDSLARAAAPAAGAGEKALARAIVDIAKLAPLLEPARRLALADGAPALAASIGLRQGSLYDDVAALLANAPLPAGLTDEERALYGNAVAAKAEEYRSRAASCYEAALEGAGVADSGGAGRELRERLAMRRSPTPSGGSGGAALQEGETK
jgi:TolA-binding protein